jgi:hypothetical protein
VLLPSSSNKRKRSETQLGLLLPLLQRVDMLEDRMLSAGCLVAFFSCAGL